MLDALLRALTYSLHPRVLTATLLPLVVMVAAAALAAYWGWDAALLTVQRELGSVSMLQPVWDWAQSVAGAGIRMVLAPLLVVLAALPLVVLGTLAVVLLLLAPLLTGMVAKRRFPTLQARHGGSALGSLGWTVASTLAALVALVVSLPLWLVPPMALLIPPLVWGWLTSRVLAYDALARHADADERRLLLRRHRWSLLLMGLVVGYIGGAPGLLWVVAASLGLGTLVMASLTILLPLTIWAYVQIFALATLWFTHYLLTALQRARAEVPAPLDRHPAAD
jgi:MFS family permease